MPDKNYIYAIATLVGTTIGAGIFGLPYTALVAGFIPAATLLLVLGFITIIINLMYAEVTLRTKKNLRLVGYCDRYIGKKGKLLSSFIVLFSLYSNILVYIIIGGVFLNSILSPFFGGNEFVYGVIVFIVMSIFIYMNLKFLELAELFSVVLILLAILGIIFKSIPRIDVTNFYSYNISESFFPFGVILFAMGALSAIPQMECMIKTGQKRIKSAIIIGTLIPIAIYLLFMAAVFGATGANTTKDSLQGLFSLMGNGVVVLGDILAIFAIVSSYLVIGVDLKQTFQLDFRLTNNKAWLLTCFVPFIPFVLGLRDFITVMNIAGSISGGLMGILVVTLFYAAKKKGDSRPAFEIKMPIFASFLIILVFILGIASQFIYETW
ncbi:MAG: aromatic amino acid transport family protein [Minisyncoccia bacterium]